MVSPRDVAMLQDLLAFYQAFADQNREAIHLQAESAQASARIGQIHNRLGEFQKAYTACQQTHDFFLQQEQTNHDLFPVIKNGLELGWATQMLGQHREARNLYESLRDRLEEEQKNNSVNPESSLLLAQIHLRLGSMPTGQEARRHKPTSKDHTHIALQIIKALRSRYPDHPTYRYVQALAYRNLAILDYQFGDFDNAEKHVTEAGRLLSALHKKYPKQTHYAYDLAQTFCMERREVGHPTRPKKNVSEYWHERYQIALTLAEKLMDRHPDVTAYLALHSRVHLRIAETHLSHRDQEQATSHLQQAHNGLHQLIHQERAASPYICDYLKATQTLANQWQKQKKLTIARTVLEKDLFTIEHLLQSGPRRRREWVLLARQYDTLVDIYAGLQKQTDMEKAR
ncbi:MAG: hypothetical protein MI922_05925, partial [Bacteroidales bacterium]|nr:hypothetical protein [Bacteroidales bacterium]